MKINSLKIIGRQGACLVCGSINDKTITVNFSFSTPDKHDRQAGNHNAPCFDESMIKNPEACGLESLRVHMIYAKNQFMDICQDCFDERINTTGKDFSIVKKVGSKYPKVFFPSVGCFVGIKAKKENELFKLLSQCDDGQFSSSEQDTIVNALKALPEVMAMVDH
jgi:hypothetical protein